MNRLVDVCNLKGLIKSSTCCKNLLSFLFSFTFSSRKKQLISKTIISSKQAHLSFITSSDSDEDQFFWRRRRADFRKVLNMKTCIQDVLKTFSAYSKFTFSKTSWVLNTTSAFIWTHFRSFNTTWKVSKYGVLSGPYFPLFGLNMVQRTFTCSNTRKWCEISSKLTIKTPERRH